MDKHMLEGMTRFIETIQYFIADEYGKFIVMIALIVATMFLDTILGFSQALMNHDLISGKMANGLMKKTAIILGLVLIFFIAVCLPDIIGLPLAFGMFLIALTNELVSVAENMGKLGIATTFLDPILKRLRDFTNSEEVSADEQKHENQSEGR